MKAGRRTVEVPGFPGMVDGRTRQAKVYGQTVADLVSDLGGEENVTRAELELARRAAGMSVLATLAEARLIAGEAVAVGELTAVGNAQRRLLATLGLERRAREVPTLREYVAQRAEEPAASHLAGNGRGRGRGEDACRCRHGGTQRAPVGRAGRSHVGRCGPVLAANGTGAAPRADAPWTSTCMDRQHMISASAGRWQNLENLAEIQ